MKSKLTSQITIVLTLSKTILVVADNSLVTLMPAKLKKAIDILPKDVWDELLLKKRKYHDFLELIQVGAEKDDSD